MRASRIPRSAVVAPLALALALPVGAATTVFQATGTAGVTARLAEFKAAIGGVENTGPNAAASGFRTINWDAVKLDGTDFNGNTLVISAGKTIGIPVNRFAARGVTFAEVYAVSGDGFASVNPAMAGNFPAFSPSNTFAMFDEPSIEVVFNPASDPLTPATVRGFGVVFEDVEAANSASIEYFSGTFSLGKFFVPAAGNAQPSFLGVLFDQRVVSRVEITPGVDAPFDFDGHTATPTAPEDWFHGRDIAVTDDFVYPEPQAGVAKCSPTDSILCIDTAGAGRFRVAATFATTQSGGRSGVGGAISLASLGVSQGGLFWFFAPDNPEVLVKVIDGCALNNKFWVFLTAGTNVGFSVSVTDTVTGRAKTYTNPDLHAATPVQDTSALACN